MQEQELGFHPRVHIKPGVEEVCDSSAAMAKYEANKGESGH